MPASKRDGFPTKPCQMLGMQARALWPSTSGSVGTSRQPKKGRPSFLHTISNSFLAWLRRSSSCGKKNMPTPYSRSRPKVMPSSAAAFWKNVSLICVRMPTPSPVLPSASLPARCSRCSTICSASSMVLWLLRPLISTTAPMPQLSCSKRGSYNPAGALRSVKFSISFICSFPVAFFASVHTGYAAKNGVNKKASPAGHTSPGGNAFVLAATIP